MNSQLGQALPTSATTDQVRSLERPSVDGGKATKRNQDDSVSKPSAQESNRTDAKQKPTLEEMRELSENANDLLDSAGTTLNFFVDDKAGSTVISIVDKQTGETIREIPSEQMRELAARMAESLEAQEEPIGLLLEKQA